MSSMEKLLELAKGLGYSGEAAFTFAVAAQKQEREERELLRAIKKSEDEAQQAAKKEEEERQRTIKKEEEERQRTIKKEEEERQRTIKKEEEERQRAFQIEEDERRRIAVAEAKELAEIEVRRLAEAKELAALEEKKLLLIKENAELDKQKLELDKNNQIELLKEQAALAAADKQREFDLKLQQMADEKDKWNRQLEFDKYQKDREFQSVVEKAKIEKDERIQISQIEANRPVTPTPYVGHPAAAEKKYIPKLPIYHDSESLQVYLERFAQSMISADIPARQWSSRLRDILTGKVLRTFQDLSEDDKRSFETIQAKLLASQNYTGEYYRSQFGKMTPAVDQSFSDFISVVRHTFDWWLKMMGVNGSYQNLYDLMIINKVYQSCNANLVAFLQERDPKSLTEMCKLGDQYYTAHPNSRVQRDNPIQAYACETGSVLSEEEVDAYAAQSTDRSKSFRPGRSWERRGGGFPGISRPNRSDSEPRPVANFQTTAPTKPGREGSVTRGGCFLCNSYQHQLSSCPHRRFDRSGGGGSGQSRGYNRGPGCWACQGPHKVAQCPRVRQGNAAEGYVDHSYDQVDGQRSSFDGRVNNGPGVPREETVSKVVYPAFLAIPTSMPLKLHKGFVGDRLVSAMFDSGANVFGCDRRLVPKSAYTGKYIRCRTFSGRIEIFPQCRLHVRTPWYSGIAEMCVLRKPPSQIIVGKLHGVKNCTNEEIIQWYKKNNIDPTLRLVKCGGRNHTYTEPEPVASANLVTTRGVTRRHQRLLEQEQQERRQLMEEQQQRVQSNTISNPTDWQRGQNTGLYTIPEIAEMGTDSNVQTTGNIVNDAAIPSGQQVLSNGIKFPVQEQGEITSENTRDSVANGENCNEEPIDFAEEQKRDPTLKKYFLHAKKNDFHRVKNGKWQFYIKEGILFRYFASPIRSYKQLVVPNKFRLEVLKTAHDSIFAGHLGRARTLARIQSQFFWPGIVGAVRNYVRSCHICQKISEKGVVKPAKIQIPYIASRSFEVLAIDLVGEISPSSDEGHRYILSVVDTATRWVECFPLKYITSQEIAENLYGLFCRMGFPDVILSDNGSQFVSRTMRDFTDLLSIAQTFSSIYHPSSNGVLEKFHRCLKQMLAKVTANFPSNWNKMLPAIMFAYNSTPHRVTGFSSHELIFGSSLRGPMHLLRDMWVRPDIPELQTHNRYLTELRQRIVKGCQLAHESLVEESQKRSDYYNDGRKVTVLKPGDEVLILLPEKSGTLLSSWQGPFTIVKRCSPVNYTVDVRGNLKLFHINMLKRYYQRGNENQVDEKTTSTSSGARTACAAAVIDNEDDSTHIEGFSQEVPCPIIKQSESWQNVQIGDAVNQCDKMKFVALLESFSDVLTDTPGCTTEIKHNIILTDSRPVVSHQFPIPLHYQDAVVRELKELLDMGIVEHSDSEYSSCLLPIRKKDNTLRLCVDYRKLNAVTLLQQEPMPDPEVLFARLARARIYSKFDLARGYWQVLLHDSAKPLTAFSSPIGQLNFVRLPFGLSGSPNTFNKLIRKLTQGLNDVIAYLDDMVVFHENPEDHLKGVRRLLDRIRQFGLTVRPTKTSVAMSEITFLGYVVKQGRIMPEPSLLKKIMAIPIPTTKRQVRSLLGLINFYRHFIPKYAEIVACLTDLTAGASTKTSITWSQRHDDALRHIQTALNSRPFLNLPDCCRDFAIISDCSSIALAGCLVQQFNGEWLPVRYVSRKLTRAESRYAAGELETLAIVETISRLSRYLLGRHFTVFTDHKGLSILKNGNIPRSSRVYRWAILLSPYKFDICYLPARLNVLSDWISRHPEAMISEPAGYHETAV